jgi:glycosyltransferase involved in cell wall biosynthesis
MEKRMRIQANDLAWSSQVKPNQFLLTAVVPVSRMAGKLENLASWLGSIIILKIGIIQVLLIHDVQDSETGVELETLVDSLAAPNIHLSEVRSGCPGWARNAAKGHVEGRWLSFWDSDDLPQVEEFLRMIREADNVDAEVAFGNFSRVNFENNQESFCRIEPSGISITEQIFYDPGLWRFAFRVSRFENSHFSDLLIAEDIKFLLDANLENRKTYFHPEVVYKYFVNFPNQATTNNRALSDYLRAMQLLIQLNSKEIRQDVCLTIIKLALSASRRMPLRITTRIWSKIVISGLFSPRTCIYYVKSLSKIFHRHSATLKF